MREKLCKWLSEMKIIVCSKHPIQIIWVGAHQSTNKWRYYVAVIAKEFNYKSQI